MKRIGLLTVLLSVTACSGFGSSDGDGSKAGPSPTDAPAPEAPPLRGEPTVDELTEAYGVFVTSSGGADDADGSRAHPLATIGKGIATAKASGKRVYVCAGTYAEALVLEDGVSVVGGLDCSSTREWKTSDARSRITAPTSPAVVAKAIAAPTRLDHLEIVAPDATAPSGSSIGLLAVDAGGLTIAASKITAGNGMKGDDGVAPDKLSQAHSPDGTQGSSEIQVAANAPIPAGPAGGTSTCGPAPGHDGGKGGAGGTAGLYIATATQIPNGAGGYVYFYQWVAAQAGSGAGTGEPKSGGTGQSGHSGPSATTWGTIDENGFTPADGARGQDGMPGEGGKGGDGHAPLYPPQYHVGQYYYGYAGSGGGAGGCPGLAGAPGKGGGASLAVVAIRSAMSIESSELVAGEGGAGGKGTFSSDPTPGGNPGQQHMDGTSGSAGGEGGDAGTSGSGAGGPSIAIAHVGGAPALTATTTTAGKPGDGVAKIVSGNKVVEESASGIAEGVHALD